MEAEENDILIPNYCLFLLAHPKDSNTYFLKEIYEIKNKTFSLNYGSWKNDSGLTVITEPIYNRRFNFNKTEMVIQTLGRETVNKYNYYHKTSFNKFS